MVSTGVRVAGMLAEMCVSWMIVGLGVALSEALTIYVATDLVWWGDPDCRICCANVGSDV